MYKKLFFVGALFLLTSVLSLAESQNELVSFSPTGINKNVEQVKAVFSAPVVGLGDQKANTDIFDIQCGKKGKASWVDTKTWIYDFKGTLASGVKCTFKLKQSGKIYEFNTGGPSILDIDPSYQIIRDQSFVLKLDGPYVKEEIIKKAYFTVEGIDEKIAVKLIEGPDRDQILESREVPKDTFPRTVILQAVRDFPSDKKVDLHWSSTIKGPTGLMNNEDQIKSFHTSEQLKAEFSCARAVQEDPCIPLLPMEVSFNSDIIYDYLKQIYIEDAHGKKIAPKPPTKNDLEVGDSASSVSFAGPFEENATYKVILPKDLKNDSGDLLSNAHLFPLTIKTGKSPSIIKFPSTFGIYELNASPTIPVTVRNVEKELKGRELQYSDKNVKASPSENKKGAWASIKGSLSNIMNSTVPVSYKNKAEAILQWMATIDRENYDDSRAISIFSSVSTKDVQELEIKKPLKESEFEVIGIPLKDPGFYVVELESKKLGSALLGKEIPLYVRTSALVTNMALHFKWGKSRSAAWVTTLDKGEPVADAAVSVWNCKAEKLAEAKTNKNGLAIFDKIPEQSKACEGPSGIGRNLLVIAESGNDFVFDITDWNEGIQQWQFNESRSYYSFSDKMASLIYHTVFDRTLLRQGETVHMKHIIREMGVKGLGIPSKNLPKEMLIKNFASGEEFRLPLDFNKNGVAVSQWTIPKNVALGEYDVLLLNKSQKVSDYDRDEYSSGKFSVLEFRVPFMHALIKDQKGPWVDIKKGEVDTYLSYLMGGVASKVPVEFRYEENDGLGTQINSWENYTFANGKISDAVSSNVKETKKASSLLCTTDPKGFCHFSVPVGLNNGALKSMTMALNYKDPNGEIQTVSKEIPLYPSNVLVGIKLDTWYGGKDKFKFYVAAADLKGKAINGQNFSVDVYQKEYKSHRKKLIGGFYSYEHKTKLKKIKTICSGVTSKTGIGICEVSIPVTGEIYLEASAVDKAGNKSLANTEAYISTEDYWFSVKDNDRMDLLPEKKVYNPGEEAKVQVRVPFRKFTALVTVEREGVIDSYVQHVNGGDPFVKVPIKASYFPNVFVSVLAVRGRVDPPQETAMVDLAKPAFKLGVTEINIGDAKNKMNVTVSADKPAYRVREKVKVKIKVTPPAGTVLDNRAEVAVAVVDEGLLELKDNDSWDIIEKMKHKRAHSVETSTSSIQVVGKRHFGQKAVPHGGDGGGDTKRELFDTLLFWNASVKLVNGEAVVEFPIKDSISSFRVVAVATSGSSLFGTGFTNFRTTQDLVVFPGVPPVSRIDDVFDATYTLTNTTLNKMDVTAKLTIDQLKESFSEQKLTLMPSESKAISWKINVPDVGSLKYQVDVTAGKLKDSVVTYQKIEPSIFPRVTMSEFFQLEKVKTIPIAPLSADAVIKSSFIGIKADPTIITGLYSVKNYMENYKYSCLEQRVSKAIVSGNKEAWNNIIADMPVYIDGKNNLLKYFTGTDFYIEGSDTLTSYVLTIADEAKKDIPASTRSLLLTGLKNFVSGTYKPKYPWNLEYQKWQALDAVSRYETINASMLDSLSKNFNLMPNTELVHAYNVIKKIPDLKDAQGVLKGIEGIISARLIRVGNRLSLNPVGNDSYWYSMSTANGETIYLLLSLINGDNQSFKDDIPRLMLSLMDKLAEGHWGTTTDNALGTVLSNKYSKKYEKATVTGVTTAEAGKTYSIDWASANRQIKIPWSEFKGSSIKVEHKGTGNPYAFVTTTIAKPILQPQNAGIEVSKKITKLEGATDGSHVGDLLKVEITFKPKSDTNWLVVDDPIPSGATILDTRLKRQRVIVKEKPAPHENAGGDEEGVGDISNQGAEDYGSYYNNEPVYVENTFSAFRAYYASTSNSEIKVSYLMRLNNTGTFRMPQTRVQVMYRPEYFGEVPNSTLEVK